MPPKSSKNTDVAEVSIEDIYKKKNPRQHILELPDTYIGSVEADSKEMWIFDSNTNKIVEKKITFVPGFYKTYDELLVNARDHTVRDKTCTMIKITIDQAKGSIVVWNNGKGIPVVKHKEHGVYIPEMIFGHLLTSSNYDKSGKTVGGKNGYGAKLANIFAKKFVVETVDNENCKKYVQIFKNNMADIGEPVIESVDNKSMPYTQITYYPDYKRFGLDGLTDDMKCLFVKRVYDLAACSHRNGVDAKHNVKVYINDKQIVIDSFDKFIQMHYENPANVIYDDLNERWKVGVVFDPNAGKKQVSFVNGIWTYCGGTHVNYILDQIADNVVEYVKSKHKITPKVANIKEQLTIFVDSVIDDPSFTSQTKDTLTTKVSKFGTTYKIDELFMKKLVKSGLVEEVIRFAQYKEMSQLKTTDGKKAKSLMGIDDLDDAFWAGKPKSKYTRLIITEGLSAQAFATSGIEIIGREKYGSWPIRGKFLNVRNASAKQISKNKEFAIFKQIMGLKQGFEYKNVSKLRYGGIIILTDQDLDGSHIKGLIINMLQVFWPSLLKIKGFIQTMSTPIINVWKKTDKTMKNVTSFYTIPDYEKWVTETLHGDTSKWEVKYFKGLGTSDANQAKKIFNDFEKRIISYLWETTGEEPTSAIEDDDEEDCEEEDEEEDEKKSKKKSKDEDKDKPEKVDISIYQSKSYDKLTLAFDETRVEDRKTWLGGYDPHNVLEFKQQTVTYSEFVDKDLIHFSNYDNIRSIPSMIDGLKPSQRKIIYGAYKKKIAKEIKVSQLANYVSEHTAYKHGETSLQEAIIKIAQNYCGSNNINLLYPSGNFGYRKKGGKDHAAARYIFTRLETITSKIFRKEDEPILTYIVDEGEQVEPQYYLPIIPMILINGTNGIGYGYASTVLPHDPLEIADNVLRLLFDKNMTDIKPQYYGFNGTITKIKNKKNNDAYIMTGVYDIIDEQTIRITEIPVEGDYSWSDKYKLFLESLVIVDKAKDTDKIIASVETHCGNNTIRFDVTFKGNELQKLVKKGNGEIEKFFKLTVTLTETNMWLYDSKGKITYYDNTDDILEDFCAFRLTMYEVRKAYMIRLLENELNILAFKIKFIDDVIKGTIIINKQKKATILERLKKLKYPELSRCIRATENEVKKKVKNDDDSDGDDGGDEDDNNDDTDSDTEIDKKNEKKEEMKYIKSYTYLTEMSLFSFTEEKIAKLNEEYKNKKKEYDNYCNLSVKEIWKKEIEEFIEAYNIWNVDRIKHENENKIGKSKSKGTKLIKSKK